MIFYYFMLAAAMLFIISRADATLYAACSRRLYVSVGRHALPVVG